MARSIHQELEKASFVITTADMWSSSHRSYIEVTANVLTPDLKRQGFAIACRRMKGCHTYDAITQELTTIVKDWGIEWKCVGMVTDNATNFGKAFRISATQSQMVMREDAQEDLLDLPSAEEEEEEEDVGINLDPKLEGGNINQVVDELPMHFRCAAHTLNLVAAKDSRAALKPCNSEYARLYLLLPHIWQA